MDKAYWSKRIKESKSDEEMAQIVDEFYATDHRSDLEKVAEMLELKESRLLKDRTKILENRIKQLEERIMKMFEMHSERMNSLYSLIKEIMPELT